MGGQRGAQGFQSTHPRGVRPGDLVASFASSKFQSTHPRGVRPARLLESIWPPVSFNPRTRVGCDLDRWEVWRFPILFQSTHPRGVRLSPFQPGRHGLLVSIHAPAWGATHGERDDHALPLWFQSTHPRGVRPSLRSPLSIMASFNPRTRVGCDRGLPCPVSARPCFNPRTRVGCDRQNAWASICQRVSIHAPAWGATVSMFYPVDSRD